jgi:cyclic beta-1,2-glucan synthetase
VNVAEARSRFSDPSLAARGVRTLLRVVGIRRDSLPDPGELIRGELFGVERLEQHAESLAVAQRVTDNPRRGRRLLSRLADDDRVLVDAYRTLADAIREERSITPAAEWLVDNFHIVDEQVREIREDLPRPFYRELPKLASGFLEGYPRVFGMAWAFVAHTDSRFDPETLRRFVEAYQRVQPLRIGELWAVAITLRVVLVENLRRIAERIVRGRAERQRADVVADALLGLSDATPEQVAALFAPVDARRLPRAFAVQLAQRLREKDPDDVPVLRWLGERLSAQRTTPEEIADEEYQRQATMNVTVRNVITSMRLMSTFDWREFFESVSHVDRVLRAGSNFAALDFKTRDDYRHAIEDIASASTHSEIDVARRVLDATREAVTEGGDERRSDPGFHLIAEGRRPLERALGCRWRAGRWPGRMPRGVGMTAYLGTIALVVTLVLSAGLWATAGAAHPVLVVVLALVALVPVSDFAIALTNFAVIGRIGPRALPKLELRDGVPEALRTLVAIPALLTSEDDVQRLVAQLEVHALANPDDELRFALLSDFTDASSEHMPDDDRLLACAADGIARLNASHGAPVPGQERFALFHRGRRWNARERLWMGWERKRGKLHELNRLLRGASDTGFVAVGGHPPTPPPEVRYVLTLDADTRLPVGAARALVGTIAHPLNRPRLDETRTRVIAGHGVLQPRVTPTLPQDGDGSVYQWISSAPGGIDPYASAVSDVYQDLFGEGSYTGKGIYDVDAFEASLAGRVPENALLSHDLFEGTFARAGLVSDISFFESFPTHYAEGVLRQHRWARGDWQLLPWIIGRRSSGVPALGRVKMADNLRRTLSAPASVATLVIAWMLPFWAAATWTALVMALLIFPAVLPLLIDLVPRHRGISMRSHLSGIGGDLARAGTQFVLTVALLPHQAIMMADAIGRTMIRLYATHSRLLEWRTAAQAKAGFGLGLGGFYGRMAIAVAVAAGAGVLVTTFQPANLALCAPVVALWLCAPVIAQRISEQPSAAADEPLAAEQVHLLRTTARQTWRFFETFVTADDNALPPDNFQEDPAPVVAHRTSPTNIGLYLLATVTARDFGWIGVTDTADRLEATFETLGRLERFRGHYYNWYETTSLRPLDPKYVSSVDSGNLVGHLLTVAQACEELVDAPATVARLAGGIEDALSLARDAAAAIPDDRQTQTVTRRQVAQAVEDVATALRALRVAPAPWAARLDEVDGLAHTLVDVAMTLGAERGDAAANELAAWSHAIVASVRSHARDAETLDASSAAKRALERRLLAIASRARDIALETEFGFLFDPHRRLLAIGYRVVEGDLDPNCYDLLASEARLASFVAIAKGDVPATHWFQLGRAMTPVGRGAALVSWSGSMFEYLMPALVMRSPAGSLLEQTCRLVVRRQRRYGTKRGVPWGVSESAFNARDLELTYQYSNFGVPGLGLERGLSDDLVITPYATALAAMVDPAAAADNLERLAGLGARGRYGFFEALDYTATRLLEGTTVGIVRAYMAHHQGMSIVAIGNVLHGGVMTARFHGEHRVVAADLLLQERVPRDVVLKLPRAEEVHAAPHVREIVGATPRRFDSPHDAVPRTHLLSNGRYAVMFTAAGSGYSRCADYAVTRWHEDGTRDAAGQYVYLRDMQAGTIWSAGFQPTGVEADAYEATFSEDRAEIHRRDGAIATTLEVVVSPEDDAEVRRVTVTNAGLTVRELEITSYAEIVLAPPAADAAHPVFSNLFVQTEALPEQQLVMAARRPRSASEPATWAAQVVAVEGDMIGGVQYETDRARFLGRGRNARAPMAVMDGHPLSNTAGSVLDPIFSLRTCVRLVPGSSARITFSTLVAPARDQLLDLADKFRDVATFDRVVTLARTRAQVQLHHLGIEPDEAHLFQRLANRVLYPHPSPRPASELEGPAAVTALWAHGISGDVPIVLVRIDDTGDQAIVRQLLRAHEYWRLKQVAVDLVIMNEQGASYVGDVQGALETLVRSSQSKLGDAVHQGNGRVFILRGDRLSPSDRLVLQTVARAVLLSHHGTLAEQVARAERVATAVAEPRKARRAPVPATATQTETETAPENPPLEFFNGLGGFAAGAREYVTVVREGQWTPAPWINVVANADFGFQTSESGSGYTWSRNSREHQLTAWSNDPVSDPPGEVFYVRDDDTGDLWGPTALPIREDGAPYVARHGQGYSRFEHTAHGVALELLQFVPVDDPVKVSRLTLENRGERPRRVTVTAYVEWVLGTSRSAAAGHVVTERDERTGALLARNRWSRDFADRVAFAALSGEPRGWTCDRRAFIGRNGSLDRPAALDGRQALSEVSGGGIDPCAALQTTLQLAPGERIVVSHLLGDAGSVEEARTLVARYRALDAEVVLDAVTREWDDVLGCVQVKTPDRAMDILLGRWLLYQTLACRIRARSAFYQAGGAYGFRDQLQDVIAVAIASPDVARAHLLRAASRQFVEGDVQHWWHPPSGRGTRTRISDDLLWLPWAVSEYLAITGDATVLAAVIPFLHGPALAKEQSESYFEPGVAAESAPLFEHCARALDRSLAVGAHGLPLMGAGDWNDGMNRVGEGGRGESVWLAWFLHATLRAFAEVADTRGETRRAVAWRGHAGSLEAAIEREGWDGAWYRRAYFDDGTPLGSAENDACRIDSIAQSWAVISGAADPERAARAMASLDEHLVRRNDGLILLFTPPFDGASPDPGYVSGYLPGVRENGGQYTHAAAWVVRAFAELGDGDTATALFALLNPINHAKTRTGVHRYKVEPYVVAADVYAEPPHVGRGGWTWYTGSAGWMYRVGLESILGFQVRGAELRIDPCIPRSWPGFEIQYRHRSARYAITVENPDGVQRGVARVFLDGVALAKDAGILLADDGVTHRVRVVLGDSAVRNG